jgi:hypothetical protein
MYITEKGEYFGHFAGFSSSDALSCVCWKNNIKSNMFLDIGRAFELHKRIYGLFSLHAGGGGQKEDFSIQHGAA